MSNESVRIGVVGLGYWGPNLARNFDALSGCELSWCADTSNVALERWRPSFPGTKFTSDFTQLLTDPQLDAIVVATPVPTHPQMAIMAFEAGKHCFVEKPLAQRSTDAQEVVAAAERADRCLMVGHLLEYHPGLTKLKEIATAADFGQIYYVYSNRLNLGKIRESENALWSLGAHDVSVLLALIGEEPVEVTARGESYVRDGVEDVVFCYLKFPSGVNAHMHLSWLDPHKERRFTVVGARQMATFDDIEIERKLTVFDKGFDPDYSSYGEYITRSGDIWHPHVSNAEPLRAECKHFVECVRDGKYPLTGGQSGLRVVRVLEALQRSLEQYGTVQELATVH